MEIIKKTQYKIKYIKINDDITNKKITINLNTQDPSSIIIIYESNIINYNYNDNKLTFYLIKCNKDNIIKILYK